MTDKLQDILFRSIMLLVIAICTGVALFTLDQVLTPLCCGVGFLALLALCCSFSPK